MPHYPIFLQEFIVKEQVFEFEGVEVLYKERSSQRDRRSLLVVFSGITKDCNYEFEGRAAESIGSNILWIRDKFHGQHTYYICHEMNFNISRAVQALIEHQCKKLGISQNECVLFGMSKGGAAAIYTGIKYGYSNILATVPQLSIGSYIEETRPAILSHMTRSNRVSEDVAILDSLIVDTIISDAESNKNIYVITSEQDNEFISQVDPFLPLFDKYDNFNVIKTESDIVTGHTEVTRYNIAIVVGILNLLLDGVAPSFQASKNGGKYYEKSRGLAGVDIEESFGEPVVELRKGEIRGRQWFPEGVAFVRGYDVANHNSISRLLSFESAGSSISFALGGTVNTWFNSLYFKEKFRDYSHAGFATKNRLGIDISGIAPGRYELNMTLSSGDFNHQVPLKSETDFEVSTVVDGYFVRIIVDSKSAIFSKSELSGVDSEAIDFILHKCSTDGALLHVEGRMAVRDLSASNLGDYKYFLTLRSNSARHSFALGNGFRPSQVGLFGNPFANHSYGYFASPGYAGVDISAVPEGIYSLHVTVVSQGTQYSKTLPFIYSNIKNSRSLVSIA